jgi:hypothetical protein
VVTETIARFQSSLPWLNRNNLNYYIRRQRNAPTIEVGRNVDNKSRKSNLSDLKDSRVSAGKALHPVCSKDANAKVIMLLCMDTATALKAILEGLLGTIEEDVGAISVCGTNANTSDYMATNASDTTNTLVPYASGRQS